MADPLRHRQTKGAATDMVDLTPPRHIPTLPMRPGDCLRGNDRSGAGRAVPNAKLSNGEGSNPAVRVGGPATAALGWGAPHVSCSSSGGSAGGIRHVPYIVLRLATPAPGTL